MDATFAPYVIELDLNTIPDSSHLMVLKTEAYRIPANVKQIRILSGMAWLSTGGQDIILQRNEEFALSSKQHDVVISSVRKVPTVVKFVEG